MPGWDNAVAAPIKVTDVLIGLVPGVKAPSVDMPNEYKSDCNEANLMRVHTRRSKVREEERLPLVVPDLSPKDSSKDLIVNKIDIIKL